MHRRKSHFLWLPCFTVGVARASLRPFFGEESEPDVRADSSGFRRSYLYRRAVEMLLVVHTESFVPSFLQDFEQRSALSTSEGQLQELRDRGCDIYIRHDAGVQSGFDACPPGHHNAINVG